MTAIDLIENIVMNLFSSQLYDRKVSIFEKVRLKCFRRKLVKWTRQYINSHDGSVLTTSDFESFLRYHHLIENIFSQVTNADSSVSKEMFINEQIRLFHLMQKHPKKNRYDMDDILKSFIIHFYDEINAFYLKELSQNEKYIVSRSDAVGHRVIDTVQKNADVTNAGIDDIKELLSKQNEIDNPELVWTIYQTLSKSIISGKVGEVVQIYPLLSGKSKDLEKSISYLLSLFSSEGGYVADFDQIQKDIIDNRIYNDACRITIYLNRWKENKSELAKIGNRNSDLKSIAQSLVDDKCEDFYTVDRSEKAGIIYFTYHVENHYPDEQWIVKRICVLDILQQPVFNASESIKQIIETPDNVLDRVVFLERRLSEIYNKSEINIDDVKSLYEEVRSLSNTATELAIDFKEKIFGMLIRSALLISNEEAERVVQTVPNDLHGCKDIDFLLLEMELRKSASKLDELINTCMKYDEYWVFNNYLVEKVDDNPEGTKQLIEKYLFVIDKDPAIFLIYAQLVNDLDESGKAVDLLLKYQEKYGEYVEFWIVKMRIMYNDTEMLNMIADYKRGRLKCLSNSGSFALVRLLMQRKMYEDALKIIERHEMTGNITPDFARCKAIALCNTKHEIESLSVFIDIFESGNHSEEIVYYILALSCNNRRTVPNSVLLCAEKSENPQILTLVASNYAMNNSIEKARNMNVKAMLRTTESQSDVFNQCLGLETLGNLSEEIQIKGVADDTVVHLKSDDGAIVKTYAIHSQHLLPEEPYCWENVNHIYKETAIKLGLFRKKTGDTICLDEKCYVIESIDPLSAYFFRISMSKVVANGKATMLSIPVTEDDKLDTERFVQIVKDAIGDSKNQFTWLDQYKDLSQIPITFYFSKRFVRGTYFQLVSAVIEDKSILYREGSSEMDSSKGDYILSYAALVVLYKLGWKGSYAEPKYAIPEVLKKVISDETEEVIRENNREHVSFMGVNDDQLYMVESTEEDKNRYMQDAVAFKSYCENYYTIENESDLHLANKNHIDIKDVLGIADYDSLLIAKNEQRILVSAEMVVSGVSQMSEIGVQTICIADFLSEEASGVEELLTYVRKMVEYKFTVPFTTKTVYRILEFFNKANEEERKYIINQWSSILNLPIEDEVYKEVMVSHVRNCILSMRTAEDRINSIGQCLLVSWIKYSGQRLIASFNEEGQLVMKIVKVEA